MGPPLLTFFGCLNLASPSLVRTQSRLRRALLILPCVPGLAATPQSVHIKQTYNSQKQFPIGSNDPPCSWSCSPRMTRLRRRRLGARGARVDVVRIPTRSSLDALGNRWVVVSGKLRNAVDSGSRVSGLTS